MTDVETSHNPEKHRYEAHLDGELAGFAEYQPTDRLVIFTHTEVDDEFEGKGVGSALARFALDDVRADGTRRVLPLCPFIKALDRQAPRRTPTSSYDDPRAPHGLSVRPPQASAQAGPRLCTHAGRVHSSSTDFPVRAGGFRPRVVAVGAPVLGSPASRPQVVVSTSR